MTETAGPRTPAGRQLVHDLIDEGPIVEDFVIAIEREAVTLALTDLRREVERERNGRRGDARMALNKVMALIGERLALIDKAVPR